MSNLVQELRSIEQPNRGGCAIFLGWNGGECNSFANCSECRKTALNALADRIEAEYDPKPEPDTLEKVTGEMLDYITSSFDGEDIKEAEAFQKRLEALGVKFDD